MSSRRNGNRGFSPQEDAFFDLVDRAIDALYAGQLAEANRVRAEIGSAWHTEFSEPPGPEDSLTEQDAYYEDFYVQCDTPNYPLPWPYRIETQHRAKKRWMTCADVAEFLGVSLSLARCLLAEEIVPNVRIKGQYRVRALDAEVWRHFKDIRLQMIEFWEWEKYASPWM